ncbi:MAG: TfoX/Sxy family protein [Qingshengfaniella sp.]
MTIREDLTERMRADLGFQPGLIEKRMFGGICFLLHGNMLALISDKTAMYRVGKDHEAEACTLEGVEPMIHGKRKMGGFVHLDPAAFAELDDTRQPLTDLALRHVTTLPPKAEQG